MGTAGLHHALARGAPLVDIVVQFRNGAAFAAATKSFNALGDDIDLHPGHGETSSVLRARDAAQLLSDVGTVK